MDPQHLTDVADAGLAQLTLGQIALNESNPVPTNKSPVPVTPRKRPGSPKLSEDESSGLEAEAKKTPKKPKIAPPAGPAGAAGGSPPAGARLCPRHKGEGGRTAGASATVAPLE